MKILFLFVLVVLSGVIITPAFAQIADSIVVTTDKTSYEDGDTILITGEVRELFSEYLVTLIVTAPNGSVVVAKQLDVNPNKTFSTEINSNELRESNSAYTITVLYGTESRTAKTTFTFGGSPTDALPYEITITPTSGSSSPGCQNTSQGCYLPKIASVAVGGKVIFSNPDAVAHTFTAGTAPDDQSGKFDSSLVMAGSSYEWTPTTKGQYDYFCLIHPWMVGIILVGEVTYIPPQPESKIIVSTDTSKYNKGETGTYTLEEALKIQAARVASASTNPAYGDSYPPYLDAGGVGIVIVGAVFGGVAGAFFIRGRSGKHAAMGRG